jgi:hypothetical protein
MVLVPLVPSPEEPMNLKRYLVSLAVTFLTVACAGPDAEDPGTPANPPAEEGLAPPAAEAVTEEAPAESGTVSQLGTVFLHCGNICPPGSAPIGVPVCSILCPGYSHQTGQCERWTNGRYCEVLPVTGSISANPTDVWVNTNVTTIGSTQICWDTSNISNAEVWLSMDGLPEKLFTRSPDGCATADWIQVGHSYSFNLYAGTSHSNLLASVTVTGYGYQGLR